jgi:drug/metabolite transporter (DMT)-like permease
VPVLSALFAIPLLGEWPSGADWAGIVVISAVVFLATGGAREPPSMIVPAAISACGKDG